jgi:hypothetical protein
MVLYICKYCYVIIGCQKKGKKSKLCSKCSEPIPCENYLNTTEVILDYVCMECNLERLSKLN